MYAPGSLSATKVGRGACSRLRGMHWLCMYELAFAVQIWIFMFISFRYAESEILQNALHTAREKKESPI
jgi:hypothetical protein